MIKQDLGTILYTKRVERGLSQHELARLLNDEGLDVSNQHIYKWEKNINRPNALQFIGLCSVLGIRDVVDTFTTGSIRHSIDYLNKEGISKVNEYINVLVASRLFCNDVIDPCITPIRRLPVYTQTASAGTGLFLDSSDYDEIDVGREVPDHADFGIKVSGNSMEPQYINGQIVWVHRQDTLENGDIGIFNLNGNAYIKKYHIDNNKTFLLSINPEYSPISINNSDDFITYGKVIG